MRNRQSNTRSKTQLRKMLFEQLEDRSMLAVNTWSSGTGGTWHDASRWDLGRVPNDTDDVVIPDLTGEQTIVISSGSTIVNSISSSEKLSLSGGSLQVATELNSLGGLTVAGGTLKSTTVTSTTPLLGTSGVLDAVIVNGSFKVDSNSALTISNGLTNNGVLTLGDATVPSQYGYLVFSGNQTLGGSGSVVFGNSNINNSLIQTVAGATLTIGTGITIRGQSGTLGYNPNFGGVSSVSVTNNGTIQWSSGTNIRIPTVLTNAGTITVDPLGVFSIGGTLRGGTLTTQAGARLSASTLDGVTISGSANIFANNDVNVVNGLTLNGTLTLGDSAAPSQFGFVTFNGTQTLSGTGTVVFGNSNGRNSLLQTATNGVLTIGSTVTIKGHSGSMDTMFSLVVLRQPRS